MVAWRLKVIVEFLLFWNLYSDLRKILREEMTQEQEMFLAIVHLDTNMKVNFLHSLFFKFQHIFYYAESLFV